MIKAPPGLPGLRGGAAAGRRSDRIVSLGDLHPTLLELAGIPLKAGSEYRSLVPLLKDPDRPWDHPALTAYDFSEFSVRVEGWRYTRYIDDSEELYDHRADPEEWTNLAGDSRFRDVKQRLAGMIPDSPAPYAETSYKLAPHHIPPFKSKGGISGRESGRSPGRRPKARPCCGPMDHSGHRLLEGGRRREIRKGLNGRELLWGDGFMVMKRRDFLKVGGGAATGRPSPACSME